MADEKHLEVFEDKIIEVGRAQARPVKGEDTLYVRGTFDGPANQRQLCAAVFDGHGGQAASADALKSVGDRLMNQGPPFTDALIASTHRSNVLATRAPLLRDCRLGLGGEPRAWPIGPGWAALCCQPEATSIPLPLTTSRPTPSGRLIRQRTGFTCPHTQS